MEAISIPDALALLEWITGKVTTPEWIQLITSLRTKLLRLEETWVNYVSGAIEAMLMELWTPKPLSPVVITKIFTGWAANDESYRVAA